MTDLTETTASNKIKYCAAISIDLHKSFDSISHVLLLIKLEKYGIRGVYFKLLIPFLINKIQFITFNNYKSQIKNNKFSVPQRSVLGSLLFIIFINYIVNIKSQGNFFLFADAISIIFCKHNIDAIEKSVNTILKLLDIMAIIK